MALFGKKNSKTQEASKETRATEDVVSKDQSNQKPTSSFGGRPIENVILHPRITEKATEVAEDNNAYAFDVMPSATKKEIESAVRQIYKVNPIKVRTVKVAPKATMVKGKKAQKPGGKKAYVFLKEGDSIEFV